MPQGLTSDETQALERLIDMAGLQAVLTALSDICHLKSEHDETDVGPWTYMAGRLSALATKCEV
jgi:hypothetical protein